MYRVIIYGCPDKFAVEARKREFNRRGLIRFLSRHVNKLVDYDGKTVVSVSHDGKQACPVNFFYVGKKHMSDRIPTCRITLPHRTRAGLIGPAA